MASRVLYSGSGSGNAETAGTDYQTTASGKRDGRSHGDRHRVDACLFRRKSGKASKGGDRKREEYQYSWITGSSQGIGGRESSPGPCYIVWGRFTLYNRYSGVKCII